MGKEEKVNIELRSEKVRNIIGNEMPFFIRYGISIIAVVLAVVALGVWAFYKSEYNKSMNVHNIVTNSYSCGIGEQNQNALMMDYDEYCILWKQFKKKKCC